MAVRSRGTSQNNIYSMMTIVTVIAAIISKIPDMSEEKGTLMQKATQVDQKDIMTRAFPGMRAQHLLFSLMP